ncbi:hypothetical protein KC866_02880 [Patescibacteria group bacterium]|nr:hypothetical protein [Patescibacteria group bacterium]
MFVLTTLIALGVFVKCQHYIQEIIQTTENTSVVAATFHLQHHVDINRIKQQLLEPPSFHITTPESVRAIYMSSWVGGTPSLRNGLITFIKESNINAVVLDIKDSTGVISFDIDHPLINNMGTDSNRIADIHALVDEFHRHNIYVIGRLTAFQDPLLSLKQPSWTFKRVDTGAAWQDRKGLSFINPRFEGAWNYLATIAEESYRIGFDEINIDYIRYPSDGNISNINYELEEGETRRDVMKKFYQYMDERLRSQEIPVSVDIFGLVTSAEDDIGIGQYFEDIYPHFDAIAPMVYPSHYSSGFFGFSNPNAYPYEVVTAAMSSARDRARAINEDPDKLRTWIQDFTLGQPTYGVTEIKKQIQATLNLGLDSYMSWDPKNRYTRTAYE